MSIRVRNWRDQAPYVGHISALVWTLYQSHDKDETSPPDVNRLHGINSFVKHGLQGHQHSDHHRHDSIEQLYFILRGRGQLLIGDDKVDVRDGTAVYMPVNVPHQAFNDGDGWMEHLIVSCPLDEVREGTAAVRDWRDVHPVVLEGGTVSWPLLLREEEAPASEGGVLQRVHSVTRYAVQGRQGTAWQQLDGIELVHYVLSGYGTIEDLEGKPQLVTEGSAAHVLPGVAHRFANQGEGWLEYVTFAVEVGEVEMPGEAEEEADSEETPGQYAVEEVAAAAVVAEAGWDDADAVEAEEEIEEAPDADAVEEEIEEAPDADGIEEEVEEAVDADGVDEAEDDVEDEDTGVDEIDGDAGEVAEEAEAGEPEAEAGEEAEAEEPEAEAGEVTEDLDAEDEEEAIEEAADSDDIELDVEAEDGEEEAEDGEGDLADDEFDAAPDEADGEEEDLTEVDAEIEDETGVEADDSGETESEEESEAGEEAEAQEEELSADEDEVDEAEVELAAENGDDDDSSADDDDFDLDDDDDFDIDDDETAEEDETGEEDDDSPGNTYRL